MFKFFRNDNNQNKQQVIKNKNQRKFIAAVNNRLQNWIVSFQRINADLKEDSTQMILRSRDLAKNNDFVTGYLNLITRNIVGADGFRLQVQGLKSDGTNDNIANSMIERLWLEYQQRVGGFVTVDQQQSGRDLDILILRTLIVDGEVFIRKVVDEKSKFGVRYEVLDTLDIDFTYNVNNTGNGEKIVMGIKLDKVNKPISYFIRIANTDHYQTGERIEIPASSIIHIYRKFFPGQVRGFTSLSATILNINQLDGYKEAEIVAARLNACNQAFYIKDGSNTDILEDADDSGTIATEYSPGTIRFAPEGYTLQQLQNNHPSGNFGTFCKNVMRSIANSLGTSYNKTTSDYESVNYSSLREAALEDRSSWEEFQTFLIDNWKDLQYQEFLKHLFLNELTELPFSTYERFLKHKFYGRTWDWVDPLKDLSGIEKKLKLRLSDPITETEKLGNDVDEVLNRWQLWYEKLKDRNLPDSLNEYVDFLDDTTGINDQDKNDQEENNEKSV